MKATNKSKITDIISKSSPTVSVTSEFLLFCLPTPYWGGGRKGAFSYLLHYPLEQTSSRDFVWTWSDTPQIGKQEILQCRRWSLPKVPFSLGQLDPCLIQRRLKQLRKKKTITAHYITDKISKFYLLLLTVLFSNFCIRRITKLIRYPQTYLQESALRYRQSYEPS